MRMRSMNHFAHVRRHISLDEAHILILLILYSSDEMHLHVRDVPTFEILYSS